MSDWCYRGCESRVYEPFGLCRDCLINEIDDIHEDWVDDMAYKHLTVTAKSQPEIAGESPAAEPNQDGHFRSNEIALTN